MNRVVSMYFMLLAVLSLLLLTACGGGSGESNPVAPQNTNGTTNKALIGDWYITLNEGRTVYPNKNAKMDYLGLKSNGNFKAIIFYLSEYSTYVQTKEEIELELTGTWSYTDSKLILKMTSGEEINLYASISNNKLNINDGTSPADVYEKKDNDFYDYYFSTTNANYVGTWNLDTVNGKTIYANNQGKKDYIILNANGKFSNISYYSTEYDNYIQTLDGIEENLSGNWSYNNGKLFFNDTSDSSVFLLTSKIENNNLILKNEEGFTLVYKK